MTLEFGSQRENNVRGYKARWRRILLRGGGEYCTFPIGDYLSKNVLNRLKNVLNDIQSIETKKNAWNYLPQTYSLKTGNANN